MVTGGCGNFHKSESIVGERTADVEFGRAGTQSGAKLLLPSLLAEEGAQKDMGRGNSEKEELIGGSRTQWGVFGGASGR